MNIKDLAKSKKFTHVVIGVGVAIVLLGVFQAGVMVGFHKASFSHRMGDNYYRAFGERGQKLLFISNMGDRGLPNAHGAAGRVIKVALPSLVVLGPDSVEKVVVTTADTEIRRLRERSTLENIVVDDHVIVIGSPNENGEIVARFIRIMPPPPEWILRTESTTTNAIK